MADYVHGTVSVGTTATLIASPEFVSAATGLLVKNESVDVVYLGGSTVTADTTSTGGLQLGPHETLMVPVAAGVADLYGVTSGGTSYVSYLAL